MKLFYITNLKSSKTSELSIPQLLSSKERPSFSSKAEYFEWRNHEDTDHVFFSAVEGLNHNIRVSKTNEAVMIHGIVADYDANMSMDEAKAGVEKRRSTDYKPMHMSQTYSGGIRLIWEFAEPISFFNKRLFTKYVRHFVSHAKVDKLLPGMDKCISEEGQYYELGSNWVTFENTKPVEACLLQQLQYEATEIGKSFSDGHPSLPIEAIQKGLEEAHPGAWTEYKFGSRGKRFWEGFTNPNTSVMHPQGIQYFPDGGGFLPWGDERLLGASFVRKFQSNRIGASVAGFHFDGKQYYSRPTEDSSEWIEDNTEVVKRKLECNCGLSARTINGVPSEVKQALTHIETHNRVKGVMPRLYSKEPMIWSDKMMYLNSNTCFAADMAEDKQDWAINFPDIAHWLSEITCSLSPIQFDYLMAYIHYAYKPAKDGKPVKLPALFMVGGTGIGKTLFSSFLMAHLLGGHTNATGYFSGSDPFNESMITKGLATIDDQESAADQKQRNKFSAILKKVTANHSISFRKMYKGPMDVIWLGKIIVTLNTDPESMKSIPNLDISNIDKVLVLRCAEKLASYEFTPDIEDKILAQLPYFARYIYDYEPKKEVIGSSRFTIKAYVEPTLLEEARSMDDDVFIQDVLEAWMDMYFDLESAGDEWHGPVIKLMAQIELQYPEGRKVLEGLTNRTLTTKLKKLESQGVKWLKGNVSREGRKGWLITNPKKINND